MFFPQVAPKSLIDPRTCLSVFNHYCYLPLKLNGQVRGTPMVDVNPALASVHHFRHCEFKGKVTCKEQLKNSSVDDTALRFIGKLQPRVEQVLKQLRVELS